SGCASIEGAAYLWGLGAADAEELTLEQLDHAERMGCGGALSVYQALCRARGEGFVPGRLWLIPRNAPDVGRAEGATAPAQAPPWGLGRTIALEAPALWGGLLDLPPAKRGAARREASAIAAELLQPDGEDQVAFRDGKRYVARLERLALDDAPPSPRRVRACTSPVTGRLRLP